VARHLREALAARGGRLSLVGPLDRGSTVASRVTKLRHRLGGRGYLRHHTWEGARAMGQHLDDAVRRLRPDAVLALSSLPFAATTTDVPTAFWVDATFEMNLEYYADYAGLADANVREGLDTERAALRRADLALYASGAAAASATGYFGADPARVHVVPWAANLDGPPSREDALAALGGRPRDRARLLFVGKDWFRKGGDRAVRVAAEMTALGLPTTLHVAGARPPLAREAEAHVSVEGFLDKADPAQHRRFLDLFRESHFLCMPVRAEDFGCVFAEAGAFALPSLATRTGGVADAVGEGGVLAEPGAAPQEVAARAVALLRSPEAYGAMARAARARYERVTNWDTAVARVLDLFDPLVR
jgi:glycosyltransferase involved in cell wall biosynthesis